MKVFTCSHKNLDENNNIISYDLITSTFDKITISSKKLELLLKNNKIVVLNLMLSDDKIVDNPRYEIDVFISKLRMMYTGDFIEYTSKCGHKYYAIKDSDTSILYIPPDVKYISGNIDHNDSTPEYFQAEMIFDKQINNLIVIGGEGLISAHSLLYGVRANRIDLTNFNTSNVTDMSFMFYSVGAKSIIFGNFDTSKVINMIAMFGHCKVDELDLSSFNTSNVERMSEMFWSCSTRKINLSSFNTSKVISMSEMFSDASIEELDVSTFDTSNVRSMYRMFAYCELDHIDISNFNTDKLENYEEMFENSEVEVITNDKKLATVLEWR